MIALIQDRLLNKLLDFPHLDDEAGRAKLSGRYTSIYLDKNTKVVISKSICFNTSSSDRPDGNEDNLSISNYDDGNTTPTSSSTIEGVDAINAFAEHVSNQSDKASSGFYSVPKTIKGEAIDGYISGAEIFVDQNFNFY